MKTANHPDRLPPLLGACNFRDLGGYETEDGRSVRIGKVFRSGTLATLTDEDHAVLDRLGIRAIYDLRSTGERTRKPSKLPKELSSAVWARDYQMSSADLVREITHAGATPESARLHIIAAYRNIAFEQAESYRALFLAIAEGSLPLAFHCAAGKDRTGVAAALLLDTLGVPRETIVEDYVFTEHAHEQILKSVSSDPEAVYFTDLDPKIWEPLMRAERDYIETMFKSVEERHGSTEGFLREALNLEPKISDEIRGRLLA